MIIFDDGTIKMQTISGKNTKGNYPKPLNGENSKNYRKRVEKWIKDSESIEAQQNESIDLPY